VFGETEERPVAEMEPGTWATLTVSDTGTGLSKEAQEHLYEPFFTTKEPGKGTGLGLAQVYGIVKQHQGAIDVETAAGEGTTFTIFLPRSETDASEAPPEVAPAPQQGRGETILVVEDADQLRSAIKVGLELMGYHVLPASHGRQALDILAEQEVDLVLTDVVMPEMGGKALLKRLRAERPHLKTIAMTGHVVDADVQGLREAGFSDALPKPFSIEDLTEIVRDVLDS
jgi:CheY-like chemotaxis protein